MKILIVTQRFRPFIGGAESVLWELARELVRLDNLVTVLTARWDSKWPAEERVEGVEIIRLPLPRIRYWGTWRFLRATRQWLRRSGREFDVWYVSMLKHCAWISVATGRRLRVPVVLRPEGSGPTGDIAWQAQALGGRFIRRRCQQASAIVALSSHLHAELEQAGYATDRIRNIPNGVPIPRLEKDPATWRQRLGLEPSGSVALFIGRLSPEKGLVDLIAAWNRVRNQLLQSQLVIVGGGPQEGELRRLAAGQAGIVWAGITHQPQRYLRAADLFVLPSHEEGMSMALLEAMALALPVVATDIPGNRSLIETGRHGLLVPPRRPDLLAQAILVQLQAGTLAAAMGRSARQRVEDEYSVTRMAKEHLDLFQSLRTNR